MPSEGYLKGVRELCTKHNVLFIADEVLRKIFIIIIIIIRLGAASRVFQRRTHGVTVRKADLLF